MMRRGALTARRAVTAAALSQRSLAVACAQPIPWGVPREEAQSYVSPRWALRVWRRRMSSSSPPDDPPSDANAADPDDVMFNRNDSNRETIPAAQVIPDVFPNVPVIVLNKNPIFPKFVKIIEIHNEHLMSVLRRKIKLNQPYAGVFVKKDDDNEKEVVDHLHDVYPIGTFVQIVEFQDLGSRLRMVLMAHRRIKMLRIMPEATADADADADADAEAVAVAGEEDLNLVPHLLLAETENVIQEKFESSDELKAIIQEVIKTIRDIIVRKKPSFLALFFRLSSRTFALSGLQSDLPRFSATNASSRTADRG